MSAALFINSLASEAAVMCGQQDNQGIVTAISQCQPAADFNGQPGQLCPLQSSDCSLRQFRCPTTKEVYSGAAECDTACTKSAACPSTPYSETKTGLGRASICVDSLLYFRAQEAILPGGLPSYRLQALDTSPGGTQHWNCEWDLPANTWHTWQEIIFTPPANNGADQWHAVVEFCVGTISLAAGILVDPNFSPDCRPGGNHGAYECGPPKCVTATDQVSGAWNIDPAAGAHAQALYYYYSVTLVNNTYSCPVDPSAQCGGAPDGSSPVASPLIYKTYDPTVGLLPSGFYTTSGGCLEGYCPDGAVELPAPLSDIYLGSWYSPFLGGYKIWLTKRASYSPAAKTCIVKQTCVEEPVCPLGYGCDCSNGTTPSCPSDGIFAGGATDKCLIPLASICPANFTADPANDGCVKAPDCSTGLFNGGSGFCESNVQIRCDASYGYNPQSGLCEDLLACPANTEWLYAEQRCATTQKVCGADPNSSPLANYNYDVAAAKCYGDVKCPANPNALTVFDTGLDVCAFAAANFCPSSAPYDASMDSCGRAVPCAVHSAAAVLNGARDMCETGMQQFCHSGTYSNVSKLCEAVPTCAIGDLSAGKCWVNATETVNYSCNQGDQISGTTCTHTTTSTYAATATTTYSCPSGGSLSGTTCTVSGSYAATGTTS